MKPYYTVLFALALLVLTSCDKDYSYEGGYVPPPPPPPPPVVVPPVNEKTEVEKMNEVLADSRFQLRGFAADQPIDYLENDAEVKEETDLWHYVAAYLKDDVNTFAAAAGTVTIAQNSAKRPGLADEILQRQFTIGEDAEGLYMTFLDYQYNPLTYRVVEFTDAYFVLGVEWKDGVTLLSRFEKLPQ